MSDVASFNEAVKQGTTEQFFEDYIDKLSDYGVKTSDDILGLMLNAAITLKAADSVKNMLIRIEDITTLTNTDIIEYSPMSRVLYTGSKEILDMFSGYLSLINDNFDKVDCVGKERINMIRILQYPKFEYEVFNLTDDATKYLESLYTKESVDSIMGELLD